MNLGIVELYVLLHIKYAGVEYPNMISKISGLSINEINRSISNLLEEGMIERDEGSSIKRKEARFKKAKEVHKHHSYYKLSRKGKIFVRKMNANWLKNYFENLIGSNAFNFILNDKKADSQLIEKMIENKIITKNRRRTKFCYALAYFLMKHIG